MLKLSNRKKIKELKSNRALIGKEVRAMGWVRTVRAQKNFAFVELNDGSCLSNLQVIVDANTPNYEKLLAGLVTGSSISVRGVLTESPGQGQAVELKATEFTVVGKCSGEDYPLQKKRHTFEFLRTIAHLRPRTNTLGAIARLRNCLAYATHRYFQEQGFLYIQTPIITASDCEGAGQLFRVSTLDPDSPPKSPQGKVDYSQDFFGKPAFLTVSGQLNAEAYALALSDVYTFGPTFRAENSNTSRHLAEFWMIEPEMAFADLEDDMDSAEGYLKYVIAKAFEECDEDLRFFDKFVAPGNYARLKTLIETPFERATYTYAIRVLEKAQKNFEYPVTWGSDLQTEHERYLTEEYFGKPVIITDYPKKIKAFYMRANEDNKTVAAMDVLVPGIGELVGGSQREEREHVLLDRLKEHHLNSQDYSWYLDLRRFGSVPHAGYGVGFERLVQFVSGMDNIRDTIPFPRHPGRADF